MKKVVFIILLIGTLVSCEKDNPLTIVYPKDYLPAYPGSWWVYSNGERVVVLPEYAAHSYQAEINSNDYTDEKLVPCINGYYLYEYGLTQFSTAYPIKTLLTEAVSKPWVVNDVNGQKIYRQTIAVLDSIIIYKPWSENSTDSEEFEDVVVVVEYTDSLTAKNWSQKEYYAKGVGLIRVDIKDPIYTNDSIIQKVIVEHEINN